MITATVIVCWYFVACIGVREWQRNGGFVLSLRDGPHGSDPFAAWLFSPIPPVCAEVLACFLARTGRFVGRCIDPVARWMFPE